MTTTELEKLITEINAVTKYICDGLGHNEVDDKIRERVEILDIRVANAIREAETCSICDKADYPNICQRCSKNMNEITIQALINIVNEGICINGTYCNTFNDGSVKSPKEYVIDADKYNKMMDKLKQIALIKECSHLSLHNFKDLNPETKCKDCGITVNQAIRKEFPKVSD